MEYISEEKTLTRMGCTLHYWVSKRQGGQSLLLLPGAGADHRIFDEQVPVLASRFNLIVMDMRGTGLSRPIGDGLSASILVDDALAVLDTEGVDRATFIGHSLGGNIAQEIAYHHPERVDYLALIDCTCNTMKLTSLEGFAVWCSPAIFAMYPEKTLIRQSAAASAVSPAARKYLEDVLSATGKRDFSRIMGVGTAECLHYDEGYRFGKPMLLLCGEHDMTGNIRKCAPKWASREPKCEFHWIKDAGHVSNMDNPKEVNRLLVDFLEGQYGSANTQTQV